MWVLRIVGLLYLSSGIWCVLNPVESATFLGLSFLNLGIAEFYSVYGGLQLGIGMAMILSSLNEHFLPGGVFFSLVLSCGLMLFRVIAMLQFGTNDALISMLVLESIIVLMLFIQLKRLKY
jgi:hypothetical protein